MSPQRFNVLVSSAGRRHALLDLFRRALRALGLEGDVMAVDATPLSAAFQSADRAFVVPRTSHPEFVPAVLELCRRHDVRLVVPTIDPELPLYAEHRDAFARVGATVAVSSPEVIAIANDKGLTHRWLAARGFPVPRQATAAEVLGGAPGWTFPLFAKPVNGSGSIGATVVRDAGELAVLARNGPLVVETIAPGVEHTIDFLADRSGRARCAVPRRRLEVRAGEVSKGVTVRSPVLEDLATRLCAALPGAYGALCVQTFLDDATGALNVTELNPRFGGGFPLACEAGAHFPRWIVEELLGLPSTATANGWRDRLVMLRYDAAVFVDGATAGL
ncbi:MAG TPA: ATP-grasp domain-containing protein [Anaeromyxobacteraceae bacterium]|nr:ATP-grasp domain-containing protein [Anaeromyxobacteraceae bacterium]